MTNAWLFLVVTTMMMTLVCRTMGFGGRRVTRLALTSHSPHASFLQYSKSSVQGISSSRLFATITASSNPEPMENVYREWTIEQDRLLWEHREDSLPELSCLLGRGLGGVERRLEKLNDVNSPAYERLFSDSKGTAESEASTTGGARDKLVPAAEVLRRIQYDPHLSEEDFVILYYDRVDDKVMEAPMDLPNKSVAGSQTMFVMALPEHRIVAIRYRERIVWDRSRRIDRVFGRNNGGQTIQDVVKTYDEWKQERDRILEWNRQRQAQVSSEIQLALGQDRFLSLKQASSNLQKEAVDNDNAIGLVSKHRLESYVKGVLQLFRDARQDPISCPEPSLVPTTDLLALDVFSELVALLPDSSLRQSIVEEIALEMNRLERSSSSGGAKKGELPMLQESELEESFVRGSGAGGQKINKTANRVVLLHKPTQLRVECQETRSLSQNRNIARKRLRYKLDEFLNGSQSRASVKTAKARAKKTKSKARNRARQKRRRLQQKEEEST